MTPWLRWLLHATIGHGQARAVADLRICERSKTRWKSILEKVSRLLSMWNKWLSISGGCHAAADGVLVCMHSFMYHIHEPMAPIRVSNPNATLAHTGAGQAGGAAGLQVHVHAQVQQKRMHCDKAPSMPDCCGSLTLLRKLCMFDWRSAAGPGRQHQVADPAGTGRPAGGVHISAGAAVPNSLSLNGLATCACHDLHSA